MRGSAKQVFLKYIFHERKKREKKEEEENNLIKNEISK
jgi:hypothetical protein